MKAIRTNWTNEELKEQIWEKVRKDLEDLGDLVQVGDLLVGLWQRPEKTASGIIITDKTRGEDIYQGKAGLILRLGSLAFQDEPDKGIVWPIKPQVGDWVLFRVSDGWPLLVGEQECRIINERGIRMILNRPDVVY